jgi:hypothetical protein
VQNSKESSVDNGKTSLSKEHSTSTTQYLTLELSRDPSLEGSTGINSKSKPSTADDRNKRYNQNYKYLTQKKKSQEQ